jgi:two-component system osmolarity sensor histidine kinase EnvZ
LNLIPRTLLGRTAVTIAITQFLILTISMSAMVYFISIPMAKRSADDFAAVIVSAAHSLQSLPEGMHAELKQRLLLDHGLIVTSHIHVLSEKSFDVPYYHFFSESLARRAGQELSIFESESGPLVWVDVPAHGRMFRVGFDRNRLGTNPYIVLVAAIGGAALLTWIVSLQEMRRVGKPLARLSKAVEALGRGSTPPAIAEEGPEEIAALARAFNRMSSDLQAMAENRTVIVAGISHDLRTPLTRLGLAIEMLGEEADAELIDGIRQDLDAMNNLIGQFLLFSKGLEEVRAEQLDLHEVVNAQAANLRRDGIDVTLQGCASPCPYAADPVALERVLSNLMENAARHSDDAPIVVNLQCDDDAVEISVCDRGPGIPADQVEAVFRPFHRLEKARSKKAGGSGLGLAIARQLAIKHGWTIELSPREGGGTVAKLGLPLVPRS